MAGTSSPVGAGLPRWVPALLAVGAVVYLSWVLGPWVAAGSRLDPVRTYASELAATDQPGSWFFRSADALAGLLVALSAGRVVFAARWGDGARDGAATGAALTGRERRLATVGWAALLAFGVATIADASAPLSCAPSADAACAARESAFQVPWTHTVHVGTSVAASIGMLVAALALTSLVALTRRRTGTPGPGLFALLVAGAAGNVIGTAWTMLEVARAMVAWPWPVLLGVAQRVQVGAASLWLVALALLVWQARTRTTER